MLTPKKAASPRSLPPDTRKSHKSFVRAAGSFVPKLTAKVFEKYGFHSAEIMASWPTVIGADLARLTQPERIKWPRGYEGREGNGGEAGKAGGATLVLRTEPAHALEVEYRARDIIDRINRYFGYRAIGQIKIVQAPLDRPAQPVVLSSAKSSLGAIAPPPIADTIDPGLSAALSELWSNIALAQQRR